jgi:hypothetical protein
MDNLNLLGSFDSVWIYLNYYECFLILWFAHRWNVLIYYTWPFSIKQLLYMLMLLFWWPVLLSIFPTCSFMLLSPPSHPFLFACQSSFSALLLCVSGVLLLMWLSDGYYKFSKMMCCAFSWCSTILLKSFICLFIYLFITQGLVIGEACTAPLEPVWQVQSFIILSHFLFPFMIPSMCKMCFSNSWRCKSFSN